MLKMVFSLSWASCLFIIFAPFIFCTMSCDLLLFHCNQFYKQGHRVGRLTFIDPIHSKITHIRMHDVLAYCNLIRKARMDVFLSQNYSLVYMAVIFWQHHNFNMVPSTSNYLLGSRIVRLSECFLIIPCTLLLD